MSQLGFAEKKSGRYRRDFSALAAAVGVSQAHEIDMVGTRVWSEREGALEKFDFFDRQRAARQKRP